MDRLDIKHIPYTVTWLNGIPYSICEDFIDENTELIPAWRIFVSLKKYNHVSVYQHFLNCCDMIGIKDVIPFLDQMIILDYIIANEDRHLNNFGVLRNPETLEWLGMAPIYDSGSSLGYNKTSSHIQFNCKTICKPFKNHHNEQLKLVSSFDWIDFNKLSDIKALIEEILSNEKASNFIDIKRIHFIANSVENRIYNLKKISQNNKLNQSNSIEDDVEENIATNYLPKTQ